MSSPDEVLPAAFALHNSPRRYALLVGSGISQVTGIFTAREITDDILLQAAGEKIIPPQKPIDWYRETHGNAEPTFTGLFEEYAQSPGDREAFLRQYFEPSEKNGNAPVTTPTPAHMSIAHLVRDGVISVIITTNFDNLLEKAIEQVTGKVPVVITYESDPRKMEVAGDHCRIVKVNGSYPGTDLKLTPKDLAGYVPPLAAYLDRIFSEYGLVICGWSGKHDTCLVKILTQERTRRFATFWCCSQGAPDKIPEAIRSKLNYSTVSIRSANEFFSDLESRIEILRRHERTTSLTIESAVKKVKDALRDPRPELILSDLLHDETDRVLAEVSRSDFVPEGPIEGKAIFRNRLEELERISSPLAAMVATIAYYDDGNYADLIAETIDRLINLPRLTDDFLHNGQQVSGVERPSELREYLDHLRLYPALLVVYASGVAAVRKNNFNNLSAILEKPQRKRFDGEDQLWKYLPYFDEVNIWSVLGTLEQWTLDFSLERFGKRENHYYYPTKIIQTIVNNLIPNEIYFDGAFDTFELLYGLSYLKSTEIEPGSPTSPLMSRQWLISVGFNGSGKMKLSDPVRSYFFEIAPKIEKSSFFKGDLLEFQRFLQRYALFLHVNPPYTGIHLPSGYVL